MYVPRTPCLKGVSDPLNFLKRGIVPLYRVLIDPYRRKRKTLYLFGPGRFFFRLLVYAQRLMVRMAMAIPTRILALLINLNVHRSYFIRRKKNEIYPRQKQFRVRNIPLNHYLLKLF
jgi:hypothetical protein